MTKLLSLCLGMSLGLLAPGCRAVKPDASVEGAPQACCTTADFKLENFKGCRIPQRSCRSRKGEEFWMRGNVWCGPVDAGQCEGGRCCSYRPQYDPSLGKPIESSAPAGVEATTSSVSEPNAAPQPDGSAPAAAPEGPGASQPASSEPAPTMAPPSAASASALRRATG